MAFTISAGEAIELARIAGRWPGKQQTLARPRGIRPNKGLLVHTETNAYKIIPTGSGGLEIRTWSGRKPKWTLP